MSKNIFVPQSEHSESPFYFAVVDAVFDDGVSLILNGEDTATSKHYQLLKPVSVAKGDKVLCAKTGKTSYVVLGALGTPLSPFHSGDKISFFGNTPVAKAGGISTISTSGTDTVKIKRLVEGWNYLIKALDYRGYGLID